MLIFFVSFQLYLVTWFGRCRGMKSSIIGTDECNFLPLGMVWKCGQICALDTSGNLVAMFPPCQESDWLVVRALNGFPKHARRVGRPTYTWDSMMEHCSRQTHWKLATSCPRHVFLDESVRWLYFLHWRLMSWNIQDTAQNTTGWLHATQRSIRPCRRSGKTFRKNVLWLKLLAQAYVLQLLCSLSRWFPAA